MKRIETSVMVYDSSPTPSVSGGVFDDEVVKLMAQRAISTAEYFGITVDGQEIFRLGSGGTLTLSDLTSPVFVSIATRYASEDGFFIVIHEHGEDMDVEYVNKSKMITPIPSSIGTYRLLSRDSNNNITITTLTLDFKI